MKLLTHRHQANLLAKVGCTNEEYVWLAEQVRKPRIQLDDSLVAAFVRAAAATHNPAHVADSIAFVKTSVRCY